MKIYKSKRECSACTACAVICPKGAITMTPDEDGFVYPVVEKSKYVHCDLRVSE